MGYDPEEQSVQCGGCKWFQGDGKPCELPWIEQNHNHGRTIKMIMKLEKFEYTHALQMGDMVIKVREMIPYKEKEQMA